MAYIGADPANKGTGLFSQDTFTGDGSTTTFDMTNAAPDGGGNELQVFVDNVRQQEGSSNAYTLGQDGSGDLKRITFTTAPEASQSIFVLNPGTRNVQQLSVVGDNTITTAKVQDLAVSTAKIAADAINATKLADDAVSEEHLDVTAITGNTELSATAADDDVLLVFDTSAGVIKKVQRSNVALSAPTFSSVSPSNLLTGDGTGNHTIVVTGTKFDASATFKLKTNGGTDITLDTVTRNSATQLTGVVAKNTANLTNANEPFDIIITNGTGLAVTATDQINVDASPVYETSAGTLGTVAGGSAISTIDIVAADPESTAGVTFELQSGSLPAGLSSATVNENGVSKFRITGTPTNPVANTTSNFVLRAVDNASNTTSRAFSITVNRTFTSTSFTSSGTFAVPSGTTSLDAVLVVAGGAGGGNDHGGGGGAGGLVFMPGYPVTPGGTIAVTIGCGGATAGPARRGCSGQDSVFADSPSPGKHPTGDILRAKGGGGGGGGNTNFNGNSGGSGGGGSGHGQNSPNTTNTAGTGTQPTQSGDSGAYGFGSNGGQGINPSSGTQLYSGGGGGAGAAGSPGNPGGTGGDGKAYTIADGTTSVYYAGGGGGSHYNSAYTLQPGGQGGGGAGIGPGVCGQSGQANKGGGGGGGPGGGDGGKGIVIVRY